MSYPSPFDPGRIAYDAYCAAVGWRSVNGEPLPVFDEQDPRLQDAWRAAAQAVKDRA